jgi:hypothetical protein
MGLSFSSCVSWDLIHEYRDVVFWKDDVVVTHHAVLSPHCSLFVCNEVVDVSAFDGLLLITCWAQLHVINVSQCSHTVYTFWPSLLFLHNNVIYDSFGNAFLYNHTLTRLSHTFKPPQRSLPLPSFVEHNDTMWVFNNGVLSVYKKRKVVWSHDVFFENGTWWERVVSSYPFSNYTWRQQGDCWLGVRSILHN